MKAVRSDDMIGKRDIDQCTALYPVANIMTSSGIDSPMMAIQVYVKREEASYDEPFFVTIPSSEISDIPSKFSDTLGRCRDVKKSVSKMIRLHPGADHHQSLSERG